MPHTWIEISRSHLIHNLKMLRSVLSENTKLMHVVKANAYGHGLSEVIEITESHSGLADCYGVHSIVEALALRNLGVEKNIYTLGYVNLTDVPRIIEHNITPTITNIETLHTLIRTAHEMSKYISITLKCETGTHRQGILFEDFPAYLHLLKAQNHVLLTGLSTHFANIEDTTDHGYAFKQMQLFQQFIEITQRYGFRLTENHIACSAALILFPETHLHIARAGISSYGLWSSKETYVSHKIVGSQSITLKPILTWKTIIGQIKKVRAGEYIGYGCTYKATHDTIIAVLPVGYYDGYDRRLSNIGYVLIKSKRAPVRGRICMNMMMVDITHIPEASLEDEVILIGSSGNEMISSDTLAGMTGTINYEIVSRINPSIERIIV